MGTHNSTSQPQKRRRKSGLFSDRFIKALKPETKMYQIREGRGFAIRVLPSGVKTWYYIYQFNGKRRHLNLGNYPDKSLKEAHQAYRQAYELVKGGIDPLSEPMSQTADLEKANLTISELANLYLQHIENHLVPRSVVQQGRILKNDVINKIGDCLANDLSRRQSIALVEDVADRAPGQARNVIKTARAMYSYALEREMVEFNPFSGIGRAVPSTAPRTRDRVLSDRELANLWQNLAGKDIGRIILLVLLTGQRPGEVAGMRWDEIDGHWWIVPAERTKNKRENRVYLTWSARSLLPLPVVDEEFVFPARGRGKWGGASGSIRPGSLSHYITDNEYFGLKRWTPHDLRRTMATGLAKLGCPDEVIDEVLNHKKKGVIGVYNRHRYDVEKRKWLIGWSYKLKKME